MPPGFLFCDYSLVLKSKLSIEKHEQGVKRDVSHVLKLCLDFHAHSNE